MDTDRYGGLGGNVLGVEVKSKLSLRARRMDGYSPITVTVQIIERLRLQSHS